MSSKDTDSFEHIYRHSQPVLRSYLARSARNCELAEDLTQETFVKAWQLWSIAQAPKQIKAWLYCVAKYSSIAEYRSYTRNGRVTVRSLQELQTLPAVRMRLSHARQSFRILSCELDQSDTSSLGKNERIGVGFLLNYCVECFTFLLFSFCLTAAYWIKLEYTQNAVIIYHYIYADIAR